MSSLGHLQSRLCRVDGPFEPHTAHLAAHHEEVGEETTKQAMLKLLKQEQELTVLIQRPLERPVVSWDGGVAWICLDPFVAGRWQGTAPTSGGAFHQAIGCTQTY